MALLQQLLHYTIHCRNWNRQLRIARKPGGVNTQDAAMSIYQRSTRGTRVKIEIQTDELID